MGQQHWAYEMADNILSECGSNAITCASGISPSGTVHAGNLREAITSDFVHRALIEKGAESRLIFSWDDFDRFRRVPYGVDESFSEHIGKPYCEIPDPLGELESYAERHEQEFERYAEKLGIGAQFIRQSEMYKSGVYDDDIREALIKRRDVGTILARNMTQGMTPEQLDNYFPISLYSRFTGNDDVTILSFDGDDKIKYKCNQTGKEDTIDFTKDRRVKLAWKADWPMRWRFEGVNFEPGGHDHASPGGSYDVASQVASEIFKIVPPKFMEYNFVRIKGSGGKMSSSKGNVFSPRDLLDVYSPDMIRWMYARADPGSNLDIAFNQEVIRAYEEFDQSVAGLNCESSDTMLQTLKLSSTTGTPLTLTNPVPFKQITGMGNATDFNQERVTELLDRYGQSFDKDSVIDRLKRGQTWMEKHFPLARCSLLDSPNTQFYEGLDDMQRGYIGSLLDVVRRADTMSLEDIESELYRIPKKEGMSGSEKKTAQKNFFLTAYNTLFGKDRGPRLGTFLWASPRDCLEGLLDLEPDKK
jgi:lysyl-tRNA synthetase, class I